MCATQRRVIRAVQRQAQRVQALAEAHRRAGARSEAVDAGVVTGQHHVAAQLDARERAAGAVAVGRREDAVDAGAERVVRLPLGIGGG